MITINKYLYDIYDISKVFLHALNLISTDIDFIQIYNNTYYEVTFWVRLDSRDMYIEKIV